MKKSTKKAQTKKKTSNDLYQEITDNIVALLEQGIKPWSREWNNKANDGCMPFNPYTGSVYTGINILQLWMTAQLKGYSTNHWGTFNQIKKAGGNVRRGEKSTMVIFYRDLVVTKTRTLSDNSVEEYEVKIPLMKSFRVFNLEQCDDVEIKKPVLPPEPRRILNADKFVKNCNPTLKFGGGRAFYELQRDFIQMPMKVTFSSSEGYYATLLHELTHWTGNENRVGRKFGAVFGNSEYAYEELVAELGAAFTCAELGINSDIENHAAYLKGWLKMCKSNPKAIFKAATEATKAAGWLFAKQGTAKGKTSKRKAA